jgi:hypothetical protein
VGQFETDPLPSFPSPLKSPAAPAAGTVQQPITVNAWERLNVPFPLLDKTVTYPAKLWRRYRVCRHRWTPLLTDDTLLLYDNYVPTGYRRTAKLRQEVTGHG